MSPRLVLALVAVAGLLVAPVALAVEPPPPLEGEAASFDLLGGGSQAGAWAVGFSGGWPWSSLRAQAGVGKGLTPLIVLDTAVFRRWEPMAGLSGRFVDRPEGRLSGELLLGWTVQTGVLASHGPRIVGRVRLMGFPEGRAAPWLGLATGHAFYVDETVRDGADGEQAARSVRHEWAPIIEGGVAIAITEHVGLNVGADYRFVGAPDTLSLPGFHVGVQFGGGR